MKKDIYTDQTQVKIQINKAFNGGFYLNEQISNEYIYACNKYKGCLNIRIHIENLNDNRNRFILSKIYFPTLEKDELEKRFSENISYENYTHFNIEYKSTIGADGSILLLLKESIDFIKSLEFLKSSIDSLFIDIFAVSELKYTNELKVLLNNDFNNPSPDFVKYYSKQVYQSEITERVLKEFTTLVKKSIHQNINDMINDRLKAALYKESEETNFRQLE